MTETEELTNFRATAKKLRDTARDARDFSNAKLRAGRDRLEKAVGRAVERAVENFVWTAAKKHIVEPEVWNFISENSSWYRLGKASRIHDDDDVKRLVAEGKSALDVVSSRVSGYERFVNTQKRILDLLEFQRFMLEAPRIAALATPEEISAFERDFSSRCRQAGVDIIQEAQGKRFSISQADVPPAFRVVARKLKLVDFNEE